MVMEGNCRAAASGLSTSPLHYIVSLNLGAKLFFVCIYALMISKLKTSTSADAYDVCAISITTH
jgi:hypothetical protein